MFDPQTLRARLTFAYCGLLLLALLLFAGGTLIAFDIVQHRALDVELATVASAEASTIDVGADGTLDMSDQRDFTATAGRRVAVAVVDAAGRIITSSTIDPPAAIKRAARRAEREYAATFNDRGERVRAAFVPLHWSGHRVATVVTWSDRESIGVLDRNLGIAFAVTIPLFGILAGFGGDAIVRRGLVPLDRIISETSLIGVSDVDVRLALPGTKELARLARTLNGMLDRLEAAFERERQFTADASHELRAPLAIILAETDLALAAERTGPEYRLALETIALEADGLEALTRRLLATARAADGEGGRVQPVDLGDIAASVAARVEPLARERGVHVRVAAGIGATVIGDANELERAVLTVVHNAVKFARTGVVIAVEDDDGHAPVTVRISDDGPGFSAEALRHGFERFWGESTGPAFTNGHGLGLSIARATVERQRGTIELSNRIDGGALVSLAFPRAA